MESTSTSPPQRDHSGAPRTSANAAEFTHIEGWGADLDIENRPAYPMERTPPRLEAVR